MRQILHLTPSDARRLPWKNNRGFTHELALWPAHASFERNDFDWRISKASISEAGPFSSFDGFDRVLVITNTNGLTLEHGRHAPRARIRPLEPYKFSGDWPTTAELTNGRVDDFNVLTRRGCFAAEVQVLKLAHRRVREPLDSAHALVHVLHGAASARITGEEAPFDLAPGESLLATELNTRDELDIAGASDDTLALLVRITTAPRG
jgi:environmental stress-induced protein Ves